MLRTRIVPLGSQQFKPAFWGVDRDLQEVMSAMENIWQGSESSLSDFRETEKGFFLSIDMPGVNKKNLDIEIHEGTLVVRAKRKVSLLEGDEGETKELTRRLSLPEKGDKDKIQAHCEDGVLYLGLPKLEKAKPVKIKVNEGLNEKTWKNVLGETESKKND